MVPKREPSVKAVSSRPETIGARLREERERLGLSQPAFSRGRKGSQIRYEKGERNPDTEYLSHVADAGADVQYIVTGRRGSQEGTVHPDFVMVPRYELAASAGHGAVIASEQIVDYLMFKSEWVRNSLGIPQKDLALINVKGDSMNPTLADGDLVLIDMSHKMIEDSGIYVIRLADTLMVKRVQRHLDGSLTVASDNQKYSPERVSPKGGDGLAVVGRVVWTGRRL